MSQSLLRVKTQNVFLTCFVRYECLKDVLKARKKVGSCIIIQEATFGILKLSLFLYLSISASIESVDTQGYTPFDYARQKGLNYCLLVIFSHFKYRNKNQQNNKIPPKQKILVTPQQQNLNNKNPVVVTTPAKGTDKFGSKQRNENNKTRDTLSIVREKPVNLSERRSSNKTPNTPPNIVVADEKRKQLQRQGDIKTIQK